MNTNLSANSDQYYALIDERDTAKRTWDETRKQLKLNKLERKVLLRLRYLQLDPFDEQQWTHNIRTYNQMNDLYKHLMKLTRAKYQEYKALRSVAPDFQKALKNIGDDMENA